MLLDGKQEPTYPTTNMGLLTVNVPAGDHEFTLVWAGTSIQKCGSLISVLTLFGLIVVTWRYSRWRWLAAVPLALLTAGIFVMFWRPPLTDMQAHSPALPIE